MSKAISKYVFNIKIYKMACISTFMLIPSFVLCFFPQVMSAAMLAWGALIMLRDLFNKRDFSKQTGSLLLLLFCIGYAITILLHAQNDLVGTIHVYCWTILEFFLLYTLDSRREDAPENLIDEIYEINIPICWVALLSGIVSLGFFFTKTSIVMPDPEGTNRFWSMGIVNGRNSGIFNNAIPCANAMFLGTVAALYNLISGRKKHAGGGIFYMLTACVSFLCTMTTLTRTYIYGVYFCVFVAAFVGIYQISLKKWKKNIKQFVAVLSIALVIAAGFVGLAEISKKIMVKVVENTSINSVILNIQEFGSKEVEPTEDTAEIPTDESKEEPTEDATVNREELEKEISGQLGLYTDITMDREELDRLPSFLYPRDELWKIALQVIPNSPVFGFTSGNRNSSSVEFGTTDYRISHYPGGVTTYHNSYFDIAVSAGLLGLGLLLFFLAYQIIRALKVIFTKNLLHGNNRMKQCYGILIGYLATHVLITSMFFNALVFNNMSVCLYFWVVLGVVSRISDHELAQGRKLSMADVAKKL